MIVLTWLRLIHTDLPGLVKQRYCMESRSRMLVSIKPEILQALKSLLDVLCTNEDTRALCATTTFYPTTTRDEYRPRAPARQPRFRHFKECAICKETHKPKFGHRLSECPHLPECERRFWVQARAGTDYDVEDPQYSEFDFEELDTCNPLEVPDVKPDPPLSAESK